MISARHTLPVYGAALAILLVMCAVPVSVRAQLPTTETNPVVIGGITATAGATAASAAADVSYAAGTAPRDLMTTLLIITAKTALDSLTQSIVNWINTGFEGSPAFVTDLKRNLSSLADAVAEDFLAGLDQVIVDNTGLSIRAPFQDQINAALREEFYRTTSSYGFNVRHPYRDCYQGRGFSFNGWFCQTQNPANNVYGRYELARNELFRRLNEETQNRLRELDWGNGFLSWRGPCGPHGRPTHEEVHLSATDSSYGCAIRTPGAIIEDQLAHSLGSGVRQLELADNFNEIVSALMSQLLNQVLGGGGLAGLSQPSAGGGASYANQLNDPSRYSNLRFSLAEGVRSNIEKERQNVATYQSNWTRIRGVAQSAENACTGADASRARQVVQTANTNIQRAATALAEIADIERQVTAAVGSNADTAAASAVSSWQSLLSSSRLPTPAEQLSAAEESRDTGDAEPGSLYSQMRELERECR